MIGHKGHPEVEGTMGQLNSGIHLVEDVADVSVAALFIGYGLYNLGNNDNRSKNQSKTWKKPVQIMH